MHQRFDSIDVVQHIFPGRIYEYFPQDPNQAYVCRIEIILDWWALKRSRFQGQWYWLQIKNQGISDITARTLKVRKKLLMVWILIKLMCESWKSWVVYFTGTLHLKTHIGSVLLDYTFFNNWLFRKTKVLLINLTCRILISHKKSDTLEDTN